MTPLRVIGVISGTSMDAVDIAVADLSIDGAVVELTTIGHTEIGYPDELKTELLAAMPPAACSVETVCRLDTGVGKAFAEAVGVALTDLAGGRADLVSSLGQTLYHWVDGGACLGTLQIGQPAWIAEATGLPVVSDLRARDVAAGGHGAPLVSILDELLLNTRAAAEGGPVAAVNIGGIANVSIVGDGALAFDTGPGNALLDLVATTAFHRPFDSDGAFAAAGTVRRDLLDVLLADPYYALAPPKSTGKEYFNATHLRSAVDRLDASVTDHDLMATLVELTAITIADACHQHGVTTVIAAGGGVRNPTMMAALTRHLAPISLTTSAALGLPATAKEAYLAALLGFLTWCGVPANCPTATGARGTRLLGSITPGQTPLCPPQPPAGRITRLRVLDPTVELRGVTHARS
jgi:anhydro-N-acetylmuramic acid kinase